MTLEQIGWTIALSAGNLLLAVVGFFLRRSVNDIDRRIGRLEDAYIPKREIWNEEVRDAYRRQMIEEGGKRYRTTPATPVVFERRESP